MTALIALFWPAALVTVAGLAYFFGGRVLRHLVEKETRDAVTAAHVAELNALKAKVQELNVAVIQLNNAKAMAMQRRPGSV